MSEYKYLAAAQSLVSARKVIQHLRTVIRRPASLLDVGCGVGGWSLAFREWGTEQLILTDHPSNQRSNLLFNEHDFYTADMNRELPPLFRTDMVVCMEVLEHIDARRAPTAVEYLTRCSDTILFSAAIPGQGGYQHVNEQYSFYWEALFRELGYKRYDIVRPGILWDEEIEFFIRQNAFLFVKGNGLLLRTDHPEFLPADFELVNRKMLLKHQSPVKLIRKLPGAFIQTIKLRLKR